MVVAVFSLEMHQFIDFEILSLNNFKHTHREIWFSNQTSLYPGVTPVHLPGLPPEFMQAIVHQISHQAAAMAAAASSNHSTQGMSGPGTTPGAEGTASPQPPHPAQARVVITRPSFSPRIPQPVDTRGTTINLRATVPTAGQQPGQVTQTDLATFCLHN